MGSAALHVVWRNPVAEFIVQDTGVGIDEAHIDRIFEPFERLETVRGQPGVGLGLTITRMLVDVMGGQLTVESRPGVGSTFRVKMFFSEEVLPGQPPKPDLQAIRPALARRRILVVDDDSAHLDLVRELLAPMRFDLAFAENGEAGLTAFARTPPDLVMMDVAMPGMDGWEAARRLRERHGDGVPILMVSANVHDFQRVRRPDDPHDDYLIKPYEVDVLIDRIVTLLDLDAVSAEPGSA